jgi:hypothetical protein
VLPGQAGGAVGEGALAGQHDAVRPCDDRRVGGDTDIGGQAPVLGGECEATLRGGEIAALIVDDRDQHGGQITPLVEGIAPAWPGSIATAMRRARAAALKQASAT